MVSNLVTPPDIVSNDLHSVTLIDPEQTDLDAIIRFCQYSDTLFNVYVYTPNMNNESWLDNAVKASHTVIVNTRTDSYKHFCLLENSYYYGPKLYIENQNKLTDPLHYFVSRTEADK